MYGSIDKIYSSPTPAAMPFNPNRQPQIKLAARDPVTGQSTAKQILATRTDSTAVPPLARSACCRSCGSDEHILTDCPVLYWSDTNTDHHIDWINSKVGKLWAQQGHKKRMAELVLPGYCSRLGALGAHSGPLGQGSGLSGQPGLFGTQTP